MKYSILSFLLLLVSLQGYSQKIHFTDSTNRWVCANSDFDGDHWVTIYCYHGDTVVNGKSYRKFGTTGYDPGSFTCTDYIREDTSANKVYIITPIYDTIERLLYNFNLQLGDTISFNWAGAVGSPYVDSVVAIDSVLMNGVYHRLFVLSDTGNIGYVHGYTYVEGIGCMNNPFYPTYAFCFEGESRLACFKNDTSYPSAAIAYSDCFTAMRIDTFFNSGYCAPAGIKTIVKHPFIIAPNPATNQIEVLDIEGDNVIEVWNINGQCVLQQTITNKEHVDINTAMWPRGMYFISLIGSSSTTRQRFVLE